jgi:hypothetical protein
LFRCRAEEDVADKENEENATKVRCHGELGRRQARNIWSLVAVRTKELNQTVNGTHASMHTFVSSG